MTLVWIAVGWVAAALVLAWCWSRAGGFVQPLPDQPEDDDHA